MSKLIGILIAAVVVLPLITVIFYRQGGSLPPRLRMAASAHALLIGLVVPYGLAVDALKTGEASPVAQLPIFVCLLLGGASMLYSFWVFRKQPVLYLAHLVTIAVAVPAVFVAAVAVTGWT
ncbi:MAG: hypothetical protein WBM45_00710 [Woeseiaceae bacterium]|jgi:hypothetical protein